MSEYTLKFGTVSAMEKDEVKWEDLFEEYYNDNGEFVAFSKETYEHGFNFEDVYKFKYKLCIKVTSMSAYLGEDEDGHNDVHIELLLVPLEEYLNSKIKNEIKSFMGVDEVDVFDIASYGTCPYLDRDCITLNDDTDIYYVTESEEVVKMLNTCATVSESINSLRGFYLDRTWNMIGNTGWDLLDCMLNGEDLVTKALNRY